MEQQEDRFRTTLDHLLEGCQIIGFDWTYIYLNQTAEIHNRRPNSELIGKRYMDMWPAIEQTEVFNLIADTLQNRISHHFENKFIFPDGTPGWFDLSIQPTPKGVLILSIDISARKSSEEKLRENEEKYRLLSDNSDDWIYWLTANKEYKYNSPSVERMTGYCPDDFKKHNGLMLELVHPSDSERVIAHQHQVHNKHVSGQLEFRIVTKQGIAIWINHTCTPMFAQDGEYLGQRATNRNITERKQKEELLMESESRFRKLFEEGPFGMALVSGDFKFKSVNRRYEEIMGYSEGELQKMTFSDITHPDDIGKDIPAVKKLINRETSAYKTEKRYVRKDGQVIWGALTVTSNYNNEGEFLYNVAIVEDITQRKKSEQEISRLNERVALATNGAQLGIWDWDIAKNVLVWDDQMYALYGIKKEDFPGAYDAWLNGLHPDDREAGNQISQRAIEKHTEYDSEFRVVWPDESIHWLKANGQVFYDENGIPLRMVGINYDITERKKAEEALRISEESYRNIFESAVIGIYRTSPAGKILMANPTLVKMLGFNSFEELSSRNLEKEGFENEKQRRNFRQKIEKDGHVAGLESAWIRKDGEQIIVSENAKAFYDQEGNAIYYEGTIEDITSRKQTEKTLQESENRLRMLLENIPIPIAASNEKQAIYFRNQRFLKDIGYTRKDTPTLKEWWKKAYPDPEYRKWVQDSWAEKVKNAIDTNSDISPEVYQVVCKNGQVKEFIISAIALGSDFLTTFVDITERKRAEEEVRKLNESLELRVEERTAQLNEANKELEAFSYSVSHDLRAPLRHVNGFVDLLTSKYGDDLPEKAKHYLAVIVDASQRMGTLIDDLLQFSRNGRKEMQESEVNMNEVLSEVLKSEIDINPGRKIDWQIDRLPVLKGDYSMLQVVWQNLVANAVKFTRHKEQAIIQIGYTESKSEYEFFVADNGAGFDMRYVHKLFGVFQRLHTTSEFEGTGIGLANVKRIIARHGGRTWAKSEPGGGATFYFSMPKQK